MEKYCVQIINPIKNELTTYFVYANSKQQASKAISKEILSIEKYQGWEIRNVYREKEYLDNIRPGIYFYQILYKTEK